MPTLSGSVALVTGASRGAGRAIALALGGAGAIVYVTGRSHRQGTSTEGLPGTIDETAEAVSALGGTGIAVRCDHADDGQIEALFARINAEHGQLDLLVNNVWGGYEAYGRDGGFTLPFWEQPRRHWDGMFQAGVRSHIIASQLAAPLMIAQKRGLIVQTTAWDRDLYLGNLFYDTAKAAVNRLAFGMATELAPHRVTALSLAPGFMSTERVLAVLGAAPPESETPAYIGRAIAALAQDPEVSRFNGQHLYVGDLARHYAFTDVDGRQPEPFRIA